MTIPKIRIKKVQPKCYSATTLETADRSKFHSLDQAESLAGREACLSDSSVGATSTETAKEFTVYFTYKSSDGRPVSSGKRVRADNPKAAQDQIETEYEGKGISVRRIVTADAGPKPLQRETSEAERIRIAQYMMKKMQMGKLKRIDNNVMGIGITDLPAIKEVQAKLEWLGWKLADNKFGVMRFEKQGVPFHLSYYFSQGFLASPRFCNASPSIATAASEKDLQVLLDKARKQAEEMDKLSRGSPQYKEKQKEMQRILKNLHKLDPNGESKFDYLVWTHSAKPFRKSRNALGE